MSSATITLILGLAAIAIALLSFWRALGGWRSGRAQVTVPSIALDADREDDPVGFSTAVWGNVALGLLALACAVWLFWIRPIGPTAADIEQAWYCSADDGAQPFVRVRNLSCEAAGRGVVACDYEAMIGHREFGPRVHARGVFRKRARDRRWCFNERPGETPLP